MFSPRPAFFKTSIELAWDLLFLRPITCAMFTFSGPWFITSSTCHRAGPWINPLGPETDLNCVCIRHILHNLQHFDRNFLAIIFTWLLHRAFPCLLFFPSASFRSLDIFAVPVFAIPCEVLHSISTWGCALRRIGPGTPGVTWFFMRNELRNIFRRKYYTFGGKDFGPMKSSPV